MSISIGSLFVSLNGMVIYTSAVIAISKHISDRHHSCIRELKNELDGLDFNDSDSNSALNKIELDWDDLLAFEPRHADRLIIILLMGLLIFPLMHISLHFYPFRLHVYSIVIGLVYSLLLIISIWLGCKILRMRTERLGFIKKQRDLIDRYELVCDAISSERNP